ncbi:hypothetical protein [Bacillus daqingensis]|uniref:hypothetical protein n=1 Tax=Bacillus daqingensis TaxID=872396 RepID=UPI003F82CDB2
MPRARLQLTAAKTAAVDLQPLLFPQASLVFSRSTHDQDRTVLISRKKKGYLQVKLERPSHNKTGGILLFKEFNMDQLVLPMDLSSPLPKHDVAFAVNDLIA